MKETRVFCCLRKKCIIAGGKEVCDGVEKRIKFKKRMKF